MRSTTITIIIALVLCLASVSAWAGNGHGFGGQQSNGTQGGHQGGHHGGGQGGNGGQSLVTYLVNLPVEDLSDEEYAGLSFMIEEEKLARDIYLELGDMWGTAVFSNISRSEQRHMDAVAAILEKYELEVPEDQGVGVFENADLQEAYDTLIAAGSESLAAAYQVGATVEDLDIADLQDYLAAADSEDVLALYQNLMKGSRNHLRAYASQLSILGVDYQAQYLTADEVEEILSTPMERGLLDYAGEPVSN